MFGTLRYFGRPERHRVGRYVGVSLQELLKCPDGVGCLRNRLVIALAP